MQDTHQAGALFGGPVRDLDRRRRHHEPLNESVALELTQTLGQKVVRDSGDPRSVVDESARAPHRRQEHRGAPLLAHDLDRALKTAAHVVVDVFVARFRAALARGGGGIIGLSRTGHTVTILERVTFDDLVMSRLLPVIIAVQPWSMNAHSACHHAL
jgi:hypothetical protein